MVTQGERGLDQVILKGGSVRELWWLEDRKVERVGVFLEELDRTEKWAIVRRWKGDGCVFMSNQ